MASIDRATLLLRIPPNNDKKEDAAHNFFSQVAEILKGQQMIISAEILIYNRFLWFFINCPSFIKDAIKGQWYSQYPNTEIEEIKDYTEKLLPPLSLPDIAGYELYYDESDLIPFLTYKELEKNPLISLSGVANSFHNEEAGIIQLILEPQKKETFLDKFLKKMRNNSRSQMTKKPDYIALEEEKEEKTHFKGTVRFLTIGKNKEKIRINLSSMLAVYKKTLERPKLQKIKEDHLHTDKEFIQQFKERLLGQKKIRFSPAEIATIFHMPYGEEEISQVIEVSSKKAPPPQNLPNAGISNDIAIFGETNFQNEKTKFGIKTEDRRRHLYAIGKSGMGKSKLLELLMQSDLKTKRGFILLDPHGDLAKEVISLVPENRVKDVVYFDPSDADYPIGFNPMEGVGSFEFRQNIVAGFISIFKKLFGFNWNERFEHVLRYTTLALLEYPQASIPGIPRMLTDNKFRQDVIGYITDPLVKKFWATEFAAWNEQFASQAIVPIINKIGQFIANPIIRNIVGQSRSGFSLDEIMNKEKILIANFSKGKLGEENSALLGSMLITKIWETAIARSSLPENERKDTFLYVDEFQNFATSTFSNILSEARKYRLNLTIAHQYMQQLPDEVRATIFGNVSNIMSFRIGGEDAQILVKEFEPTFAVSDFLNLDLRNFYIKMSIDGKTSQPFSATTITVDQQHTGMMEKIIENSRNKYAKSRKAVEEEIQMLEKGDFKKQPEGKKEEEDFFPEPIV